MFRFAPYILKGLWRHRTRTLLTVSGTAVALAVFCFIGAMQQGLQALTADEEAGQTLVVFQENRFCPAASRLPHDYATQIAKLPGVVDVVPIKVFTNNCRASLDAIVFHGAPTDQLKAWRDLKLKTGDWNEFERLDDGALIGQTTATRRDLKMGDKFTIGGVSVVVAGIFASNDAAENGLIYTHLDFLQRARGASDVGTVTQLEVHLNQDTDVDALAKRIDAVFRTGPVATTTRTKGMFQADTLADLAELIGFVHWLGYACVGLVLSLVATTTVMSVQDRISEHAVLQTLGLRPARIFRIVVAESALQSAMGGILGVACSVLLLSSTGMSIAAEGVTIAFQPTWPLTIQGVIVAIVVGTIAGITPAWQAAQTRIVPALRRG